MNKQLKTAITFVIFAIILTLVFGIVLKNYIIGLIIGLFLSLSFCYDPKKNKSKDNLTKKK